jgi:zinc transporter
MANEFGILHACSIDGDGHGAVLTGDAIAALIKDKALAWVHLDATHPGARVWLEREISYLDPIILDALLAEETRPRMVMFEQGALMILRGVNLNEDAQPEDMVSIRLWIDGARIISLRRRRLKAVADLRERLAEGTGPRNSADFIAMLTARLFERMEPVLGELDENLDDVEQEVMESPTPAARHAINNLRKQAIVFRRYIAPQRDVIAHLRTSELPWLDAMNKRRLQENLDMVIRYIEDLDAIRERAQIVKDELANGLADRMNRNLYVLSVIAAIFLPLGFLTGLLGINVGGIPGSDNPMAFLFFVILLFGIGGAQIATFKYLKWI